MVVFLSSMIKDLENPKNLPDKTNTVEVVQTHISLVFIGDEYVYKIKKPVNFGFLDFSTLKKRKFYCGEEVELNSRFSKDVYLGVLPVTYDGAVYQIDGKGKLVDYAVKMRRLAEEDLLKTQFFNKTITDDDIRRIAKAIAKFHKNSLRSDEIDNYGSLKTVKFNTDENFEQTKGFINKSITQKQFDDLKKWTDDFYKNNKALFSKRISEGKIRDCHGDLHMEHICLTDPIIIFDCIEFNERFRYSDILSDISFLLMDLEYNGGKRFAELLCKTYLDELDESDESIYELITYYKVYRAYVRGKVTSFILNDPSIDEEKKDKARKTAQRYFSLAHSFISK